MEEVPGAPSASEHSGSLYSERIDDSSLAATLASPHGQHARWRWQRWCEVSQLRTALDGRVGTFEAEPERVPHGHDDGGVVVVLLVGRESARLLVPLATAMAPQRKLAFEPLVIDGVDEGVIT